MCYAFITGRENVLTFSRPYCTLEYCILHSFNCYYCVVHSTNITFH